MVCRYHTHGQKTKANKLAVHYGVAIVKDMDIAKSQIKGKILEHLMKLGYEVREGNFSCLNVSNKDHIRTLYAARRQERESVERGFLNAKVYELIQYFADGSEVQPARIAPRLEEVRSGTWQADLFRLSTMLWSVPVSRGFGRRMRFLVWDRSNRKLIGLIALGDPVFNLKARDNWIGWDVQDRIERLCNIMDAYVLGAVPPYSHLIGGKLVAALVASKKLNEVFRRKYSKQVGLISKKAKNPKLVMATTTSALGRSSIYNRLKMDGRELYKRIGSTKGWGHFHIPEDLFQEMKVLLRSEGHAYPDLYKYGDGPNWRIRVVREAFNCIGLNQNILNHGVQREVYAIPLARNATRVLRGEVSRAGWELYSSKKIGEYCVQRWMVPRSERDHTYKFATRNQTLKNLIRNGH